ncbi:hypothetical protein CK203_093637 [Vitis vinifera]|uniref:Uncharacterized protein n=1 Tax=Vitis vinifera TaxID=29760 RepID=A0A438CI99_VITVI|nr:hypothetical protein CK203_093637 [Vitis vinifera]
MSTSSLEQAILKISKVMEDFVGTNAKRSRKVLNIDTLVGNCYDNSMDQPSIENHKVQDDKGLPEPLKHPLLQGREEKQIPLDKMGRMPILFGIQGEFSMKWESIASNGARFGVETKKLWPFEDDCAKLNWNVATAPHFATEFRSPVLQTVCDLDLKRRSYGHLKESNFAFGQVNSACAKFSYNTLPCAKFLHNTSPCAKFSHHSSLVQFLSFFIPTLPNLKPLSLMRQLLKVVQPSQLQVHITWGTTSFLLIFDSNIEDNVHLG